MIIMNNAQKILMNLDNLETIEVRNDNEVGLSPRETMDNIWTLNQFDGNYIDIDAVPYGLNSVEKVLEVVIFNEDGTMDLVDEKLDKFMEENNTSIGDTLTQEFYLDQVQSKAEKAGYLVVPIENCRDCYYMVNDVLDYDAFGIAYVSKDTLRHIYGVKNITKAIKQRAYKELEQELRFYSAWANNELLECDVCDVYGDIQESVCNVYLNGILDDKEVKKYALDCFGNEWEDYNEDKFEQQALIKLVGKSMTEGEAKQLIG